MFCNRVKRKNIGSKAQEVPGGWKILHNGPVFSTNIIRGIKSSRMSWEGNMASTEGKEAYAEFG
jgi:hypothetical protein